MESRLLSDHGSACGDGSSELVALGLGITHAAFPVCSRVAWGACQVVEHGRLNASK